MKIIDIKTYVVGTPPPHYGGRNWVFLKLTTDTGIDGVGEAYKVPFHPKTVEILIQESIGQFDGFHAEILKEPLQWEDGYIIPPTRPGLGVELNEEVAAEHPYLPPRTG